MRQSKRREERRKKKEERSRKNPEVSSFLRVFI